jgi:hypothetical protein
LPGLQPAALVASSSKKKKRMRAILYAQFFPVKTLPQLVSDRNLYRLLVLSGLAVVLFS